MKKKNKLEYAFDLANFLFEKQIPFKYKRQDVLVVIAKIEMTIPNRGKVKVELMLDSENWKSMKRTTLEELYKSVLSKIL